MSKEILKCVHQLKGQMNSMQQDIDRIKTALAAQLPPEHQEEVFHFTLHDEDDIDAFEEFCNRLKNANFRQLVVSLFQLISEKMLLTLCMQIVLVHFYKPLNGASVLYWKTAVFKFTG